MNETQATTTTAAKTYAVRIVASGGTRIAFDDAPDPAAACQTVEREKLVSEIDRGNMTVKADAAVRDGPDWSVSLVGAKTVRVVAPDEDSRSRRETERDAAETKALEQVDTGDLHDVEVVSARPVSCSLYAGVDGDGVSLDWYDHDVDDQAARAYVDEQVRPELDGRRLGNTRRVGRLFLDEDGHVVDHDVDDTYRLD